MRCRGSVWFAVCAFLAGTLAWAQESDPVERAVDYGFEGRLDRMDARLAPDLREGLVISGVYSFFEDRVADDLEEDPDRSLFADLVGAAEVVFDRDHVWVYEARAGVGESRLELRTEVESEGRTWDLYGVALPLGGEPLGEAEWTPRWLQLWLYGPAGEMLDRLGPQPPPEQFTRGWWRLTFWNAEGSDSIAAEGPLTAAGAAGSPLSPSEQMAALEDVVVQLSDALAAARSEAERHRSELETARRRMEGLQSTIDLLISERENLRSEVARLSDAQADTPEALESRLAELEAEDALWAEKEAAWKNQQRFLTTSLAEAEAEVARLQRAQARLERVGGGAAPAAPEAAEPAVIEPPPPTPGPIAIVREPDSIVETTRPITPQAPPPVVDSEAPPSPPPAPPEVSATEEPDDDSPGPVRPGKFRRGRR